MKLSQALAAVTAGSEKTAAAPAPSPAPSAASIATPAGDASTRLKQALQEAIAPDSTAKTASAGSPVEDLTKIAVDLSKAEHEAMTKEAQLYGAALCDGFMARAAQYKQAASQFAAPMQIEGKVASLHIPGDTFEKFAAENADLVKEAAELGYRTTVAAIQDLHQRAYDTGWNKQVEQIHKHGCDAFMTGFKIANDLITEASR